MGIALGALIVWILARRRKRRQDYTVAAASPSQLPYEPPKVYGGYKDQFPIHEMGSGHAGLSEMDGMGPPVEMQAVDIRTGK